MAGEGSEGSEMNDMEADGPFAGAACSLPAGAPSLVHTALLSKADFEINSKKRIFTLGSDVKWY